MAKELAIIKEIQIGKRDCDKCICWFVIEAINGSSLQIIEIEQLVEIINKHDIYDFKELEGAACIIENSNNTHKFIGLK